MKMTIKSWCGMWITLGLLCPLAAQSQQDKLYFKADLGGTLTSDTDLRQFFGEDVTGVKVKFDPGYRFGIGAGYELLPWFAVEGEIGAMGNWIKSIDGADRVDAYFSNVPFILNAKLQGPKRWIVSPYVGAGAGGSASILSIDHISYNGVDVDGTAGTVVFAWQAFAGIRVALAPNMGLAVEYRYFHADSPTWTAEFTSNTGSDKMQFGRTETQAFSIAFDWRF